MISDSFSYPHQPQYPPDFPQIIQAMKQKLYQTIMTLSSDEPLKQLTFSPELSQFKYGRIREILNQTFNLSSLLEQATGEITKYKNRCYQLEIELQEKNRDQLTALQQVQKKFTQYKHTLELQRNNIALCSPSPSPSSSFLTPKLHQLSKTIQLQHQQISHYKLTIRSMQQDMIRIRNEWEKRCRDIEIEGENEMRYMVEEVKIEAQGKLDMWLEEIEKENGQIVVREDLGRLEEVRKEYRVEVRRVKEGYQKVIEELQVKVQESRVSERREKEEVQSYLKRLNELKEQIQIKQDKMKKENNILKSQIDMITSKNQQMLRQKMLGERKLTVESQGLTLQLSNVSLIVQSKQHQILLLKQKFLSQQTLFQQLKQSKHYLSTSLSQLQSRNIQLQSRLLHSSQLLKSYKQKHRKSLLKLQGLKLACIRLRNHQNIQRDQIKYQLQTHQRRIISFRDQITRYMYMQLEKCEGRYMGKLNSLMYQFESNQKNQNMALEEALKDNQYLRGQLKDYQDAFEEKMEEVRREKVECREDVEEEIEGLRRGVMKMVKGIGSERGEMYEKVKDEIQKRNKEINKLGEENREIARTNYQLKRKIQILQTDIEQSYKEKKHAQKQLRQAKAELMVKNNLAQQYSKQNKQKQNTRSNINRQEKEKQMQEIRTMLAKTYSAVGSQMPEKHNRRKY